MCPFRNRQAPSQLQISKLSLELAQTRLDHSIATLFLPLKHLSHRNASFLPSQQHRNPPSPQLALAVLNMDRHPLHWKNTLLGWDFWKSHHLHTGDASDEQPLRDENNPGKIALPFLFLPFRFCSCSFTSCCCVYTLTLSNRRPM